MFIKCNSTISGILRVNISTILSHYSHLGYFGLSWCCLVILQHTQSGRVKLLNNNTWYLDFCCKETTSCLVWTSSTTHIRHNVTKLVMNALKTICRGCRFNSVVNSYLNLFIRPQCIISSHWKSLSCLCMFLTLKW